MLGRIPAVVAFAAVIITGTAPASAREQGPSFSCRYASLPAERAVCRSRLLSRLDRVMSATYFDLRNRLDRRADRDRLTRSQRNWLLRRNDCGWQMACLSETYDRRIAWLTDRLITLQDAGIAEPAVRPSFACTGTLSTDERTICRRSGLARLDRQMSALYDRARGAARNARARRTLRDTQRDWLTERRACGSRAGCLREVYLDRITTLEDSLQEAAYTGQGRARPSFDCDRARTQVERMICSEALLARLDRRMAARYRELRRGLSRADRRELEWEQRDWLARRNECAWRGCLQRAYGDRIFALENALAARRQTDRAPDARPSFDCDNAGLPAEQLICAEPELARLDRRLAEAYRNRREATTGRRAREDLEAAQRTWLVSRNRCGTRYNCVREAYADRIWALER